MRTLKTERRIDSKIRLMRIAGVLCALFAAAGICHGMHEANPDGGWLVPAFAGLVAASALAIFWHVVIGSVVGMVRLSMIVTLFVAATVVTVVALGASAQAIATAVAGRAALSAELSALVDGYNQKLAEGLCRGDRLGQHRLGGRRQGGRLREAGRNREDRVERHRQGLRPALRFAARHLGSIPQQPDRAERTA